MAIPVGAELGRRVVDMEGPKSVEADRLLDLVEAGVESCRVGDVDSRDPQVARVEADAHAGMSAEAVDERGELLD